jgi:hypothetical protein
VCIVTVLLDQLDGHLSSMMDDTNVSICVEMGDVGAVHG